MIDNLIKTIKNIKNNNFAKLNLIGIIIWIKTIKIKILNMMLFIEIIIIVNKQTLLVKNFTNKIATKENKIKDKFCINQRIRLKFRISSDYII